MLSDSLPLRIAPPLGFRFSVFFFAGGVLPNPFDIRFKRVSGIGASVTLSPIREDGKILLPDRVQHENLVLERGLAIGSPLVAEFNAAMSLFEFHPSNVLVSLLDESALPLSSWLFHRAYPVKWVVSGLDADSNAVAVETMELTYQRMQSIRI